MEDNCSLIGVDITVYFLAVLCILFIPLFWLFPLVIASVFHELCHILVLLLLKGKITAIRIQADGCRIDTDQIKESRQFLSILAGPLGSLSLILIGGIAPRVAVFGLIQGLYNLIPVLPMDGGRLLRLVLYRSDPQRADSIQGWVAISICIFVDLLAIAFSVAVSGGWILLIIVFLWNLKVLPGKTPCKPGRIGVQ